MSDANGALNTFEVRPASRDVSVERARNKPPPS